MSDVEDRADADGQMSGQREDRICSVPVDGRTLLFAVERGDWWILSDTTADPVDAGREADIAREADTDSDQ